MPYAELNKDGCITAYGDKPFGEAVWVEYDVVRVGGQLYRSGDETSPALSNAQTAKRAEINAGFEAALVASLTMPSVNPSAVEVAVGATALAAVDPDGPAYIMQTHTARRTALLAAVDAATTLEAVQAITVSYAV